MRAAGRRLSCGMLALTGLCWFGAPASSTAVEQDRPGAEQASAATRASIDTLSDSTGPIGSLRFANSDARPTMGHPHTKTDLERQTGLTVSIDDIRPAALTPGEVLTVTGSVINDGPTLWRDAQVYLEVGAEPATTRTSLTNFADSDIVFGTRIVEIGLFDEIGPVQPGDSKTYNLQVPFARLPITRFPGAYHIGVSVLAQNEDGRDVDADARTDTLMPFLPRDSSGIPTKVVTLIPLTAPVLRLSNGNFLDDSLVEGLSAGGRLRNVLSFAAQAPRHSLQIVIDPALRDAVQDMAGGYLVQTAAEAARGDRGHPGGGQREAADWLAELDAAAKRQRLSLMAWGSPDASELAAHHMPGIVEAAVTASRNYAAGNQLSDSLVGWQTNGDSTRRGLLITRQSGTSVQVVAERSLPRLTPDGSYPPAVVSLPTELGPLTALVVRKDVAGEALTAKTSAIQFRQNMLAETTVRSLSDDPDSHVAVFAVPFRWDPGVAATTVDLSRAYTYPAVEPRTGDVVDRRDPTTYTGPVRVSGHLPPMSSAVISAIASLRDNGRILTGMLSDRERASIDLNEKLGVAGSSAWRRQPRAGASMIREQASQFGKQVSKVTVTGPTFVALSSDTGRFPLTVTNRLDQPIVVRLDVKPRNPALKIDPIEAVELAAGQRRDVQVTSRTDGSGLTEVRVRLSTPDDRHFGSQWRFNVRATQFGLVIWIAMGAGAAVLFGAALLRIYSRIKGSRASAGREPAAS